MKSLKPFLLVLAGVLITVAIFSFKNANIKIETSTLFIGGGKATYLCLPDGTNKPYSYKGTGEETKEVNKILNELSLEGWEIKGTNTFSSNFQLLIYLQRIKQ